MIKFVTGTAIMMLALGACQEQSRGGQGGGEGRQNPLASLGVTEAQMDACKPTERPAQGADTSTLVSCLQSQGASVTQAQVDAAISSRGPRSQS